MINIRIDQFPSTVGIIGSREFPKLGWVRRFVDQLNEGTRVVSGGARGVDITATNHAEDRGLETMIYWPDKKLPVPARFFERNTKIVMDVKKAGGLLVAFELWPRKTGGTKDSLTKCDKYDIPYIHFRMDHEGQWLDTWVGRAVVLHEKWRTLVFEDDSFGTLS
jgi:hypothetical protein